MAYTSLERSINARKQPRDKKGRWVTTGARLRAAIGAFSGNSKQRETVNVNNLRAIGGNDDGTKIRSYVTNDDFAEYGIKKGDVLEINSSNGELLTAQIDKDFLRRKGIDPDLAHELPEDVADQPQNIEDLNITEASELDREMALGELTDEEDAEFRKEREAEPLAKLPPALSEQAKTGQDVSDIVGEPVKKKKSFAGLRDLVEFLNLPKGTKIRQKGPTGTEGDWKRFIKNEEDGQWYKVSNKTGKQVGKPLTRKQIRGLVSDTSGSSPLETVDEFDKTPFRDLDFEKGEERREKERREKERKQEEKEAPKLEEVEGSPLNLDDDDEIIFEDDEPKVYPEEPARPLQQPTEEDLKDKEKAEQEYEEPEETEEKVSLSEIEALGQPEEYVEDFDGFTPSDEQTNALNAVVRGGYRTVVNALAGSGKTTTLVAAAKAIKRERPKSRVLALQFNKKNQLEAERRMPKENTEARTTSSLAYAYLTKDQKAAMNGRKGYVASGDKAIAKLKGYDEMPLFGENFTSPQVANIVGKIVGRFSNSDDKEISRKHVLAAVAKFRPEDKPDAKPDDKVVAKLLDYANDYWADVQRGTNPNYNKSEGKYEGKRIRVQGNHSVKMWSLSEPDLSEMEVNGEKVDTVFFDEAQDTNAAVAAVVKNQKNVQIVHVGDPNQAIYEWNGAINALKKASKDAEVVLPLTMVRRFGPELAGPGNAALNLIGSDTRIRAVGEGGEIVDRDAIPMGPDEDTVIIVRSNSGGLNEIQKLLEEGRSVGVLPVFKTDLENAVYTLKWLKDTDFDSRGASPKTPDGRDADSDDFAGLRTMKDVRDLIAIDKEARASKWIDLLTKIGGNDWEAGLKEVEDNIIPNLKVLNDSEGGASNLISDEITGAPGEEATLLDIGGQRQNYKVNDEGNIEISGDFKAVTAKIDSDTTFKDYIKSKGFRWNGANKVWSKYMPNADDEQRASVIAEISNKVPEGLKPKADEDPDYDVRVTTTHRMKGLEADNVIIGEDFPEPKEALTNAEDGTPTSETKMPSMEEMRTIYVAVTRAREKMSLGKLGWLRDYQGREGVVPANEAMDREPDVGAAAWNMPQLEEASFSPSGMLDDDEFDFDDDVDGLDVDPDDTPSDFDRPVRTTRRAAVEDLDPDDDTFFVDPETGKNVRLEDSEGLENDEVLLIGTDEAGDPYEKTFRKGNRVSRLEFGEPEPREEPAPREPETPKAPEPKEAPSTRTPGKTAADVKVGDEIFDDEGGLLGKVTNVRKGRTKSGIDVVSVEHDGADGKITYAKDEPVDARTPEKKATPEQAEVDAKKLVDDMRKDNVPEDSLPTEFTETPSFVETWTETVNGTYSKYVNGERWNVKQNKDGTITLRPRTNPQIGTKKYNSWDELEADFPNRIKDSDDANLDRLEKFFENYDRDGRVKRAIDRYRQTGDPADFEEIQTAVSKDDDFQDDLEDGNVSPAATAARLSRVKKDGTDALPLERRKPRSRPVEDRDLTDTIDELRKAREALEETRRKIDERRRLELERRATEDEDDYEEEIEDVEEPEETVVADPTPDVEDIYTNVPEGFQPTPAGLIPTDLERYDNGVSEVNRTPFRPEDIQEAKGSGTPEDIKAKLLEYYPEAGIASDGSIVVHRKTYKEEFGPAEGQEVSVQIKVKETDDNKMMLVFDVDVDGRKEQYIHYSPRNSFASLVGVGGKAQQSRGIENLLNKYIERPDEDFDLASNPDKERRLYGGAYGGISRLRKANADNIAETGKNDTDLKLRTPEEHAKIMLSGRNQQLNTDDTVFWTQRRGEVPSFYSAFDNGDQEAAARIFASYVGTLPNTPEQKDKAYDFLESSMREKFPNANEEQLSAFLSSVKSRLNSGRGTDKSRPIVTHVDRDNKQLAVGDVVEWKNNEGVVSRGRIVALKAVENPNDGKYTFSDYAEVEFKGKRLPEGLNTNNMKLSDDQDSEIDEYSHWIREEDLALRRLSKRPDVAYDPELKVFYRKTDNQILKDFEGRTEKELEELQTDLAKQNRKEEQEALETPDKEDIKQEVEPRDTVPFKDDEPVSEAARLKLRGLADRLRELRADDLDEDTSMSEEYEKIFNAVDNPDLTANEYQEVAKTARNLLNKIATKQEMPTPKATPAGETGAASSVSNLVPGVQLIPRRSTADAAEQLRKGEFGEAVAPVKGDKTKGVYRPTDAALSKVEEFRAGGEDVYNKAVKRFNDNEEFQANVKKLEKEIEVLDAKKESARLEVETSVRSGRSRSDTEKLRKKQRAASQRALDKRAEVSNLFRRALKEELEEQGVEFNVLKLDKYLHKFDSFGFGQDEPLPSSSTFRKSINDALQFMPRPIIQGLIDDLESEGKVIRVSKSNDRRGYFGVYTDGSYGLQLANDKSSLFPEQGGSGPHGNNALHELWHFVQKTNPDLVSAEGAYVYNRSKKVDEDGNEIFELSTLPGYSKKEVGLVSDVSVPYSTKVYLRRNANLANNPDENATELGTTLFESVFGTYNNRAINGQGLFAVAKGPNGRPVIYRDVNARNTVVPDNVKTGYYNSADGKWYEDSAFSNPIDVSHQVGRPVDSYDQDAVNYMLGTLLAFKTKEGDTKTIAERLERSSD